MNTAGIDPLALLAVEADARARTEQSSPTARSSGGAMVTPPIASTSTLDVTPQSTPPPATSPLRPSTVSAGIPRVQTNRRKPSFALKLHAILADKNCGSVITWLPAGKSFVILDKTVFTNKCLPEYFRESKFESFSRRLKRWGFKKIFMTSHSQTVYSHDLFQRDRLDLCKLMNGHGKISSNHIQEDVSEIELENTTAEHEVAELKRLAQQAEAHQKALQHQFQVRHPFSFVHQATAMPSVAHYEYMMGYNGAVAVGRDHQRGYIERVPMNVAGFPIAAQAKSYLQGRPTQRSYHGDVNSIAADEFTELDNDISRCQEQLAVLRRLRMLKERCRGTHR